MGGLYTEAEMKIKLKGTSHGITETLEGQERSLEV